MKRGFLLLAGFTLQPLAGFGAALPVSGSFTYSNACATQGGDFGGYRVTLRRGAKMLVMVEFNDDGPDGRDSGRDVVFDSDSGRLRFSFRGSVDGDSHNFEGTVSAAQLKGLMDGTAVTLPRLRKIPKELPDC